MNYFGDSFLSDTNPASNAATVSPGEVVHPDLVVFLARQRRGLHLTAFNPLQLDSLTASRR